MCESCGAGRCRECGRDAPGHGRWLREGGRIVVLPGDGPARGNGLAGEARLRPRRTSGRRPAGSAVRPAAAAGRVLSYPEVIDERISVPAQHSLVRLSRNPASRADAAGLLAEVKAGRLGGIFCVNWKKAAQRAIELGASWWTVIPRGEDAVLLLDPADLAKGPPLVAFRRDLDPDCGLLPREAKFAAAPGRLDAALRKAWRAYGIWRSGALKCGAGARPPGGRAPAGAVASLVPACAPGQPAGQPAVPAAGRTVAVGGQVFNRLMFYRGPAVNPRQFLGLGSGGVPAVGENVFSRRGNPGGIGFSVEDYPMSRVSLRLIRKLDRSREEVLETIGADVGGGFRFTRPIPLGGRFILEATLSPAPRLERFHPERIRIEFQLPRGLTGAARPIRVKAKHELNIDTEGGVTFIHVETEDVAVPFATAGGAPILWFGGSEASVVFDTFALRVPYLSQLPDPRGMGVFTASDGTRRAVALENLCLPTCSAMVLRHYGLTRTTVQSVVRDVAKFFLDNAASFPQHTLDPAAGAVNGARVIRFTDGSLPHNRADVVGPAVASLLAGAPVGSRAHFAGQPGNLLSSTHPSLRRIVSFGWPAILVDDLPGVIEHGGVCFGLVVKRDGGLDRVYVHDPLDATTLDVKVNTQVDRFTKGWIVLSRELPQSAVTPPRLAGGGSVPAPARTSSP